MEKTVARSQQDENAFDPNSDGVIVRAMDGKIDSWNGCAAELYGWRKEEAIGRISHDLFQTQFPMPLEEIQSELVRNGHWEGKLVHTTRDGGRVVVESRWALDLTRPSEVVIEINRVSDPGDPHSQTVAATVRIPTEPPEGKLIGPGELLAKIARIADLILISGGVLATLLTFYVIYYYSWEAERQLPNIVGHLLYSLPAGVAVLLFSATCLRAEDKINIALVCLALTISIYGVEIFLSLSNSGFASAGKPLLADVEAGSKEQRQKAAKLAKQFGVNADTRDRVEVITDLRNRGIDAVTHPLILELIKGREENDSGVSALDVHGREVIPLSGIANKVTVLCNESGEWVTYHSDEHGFHNPKGIWQSGPIDIATIGDSFTEGYCVPSNENFVALVRNRHPATLNLGIADEGPLAELATLKEYLPLLAPKIVLWFYYEGNDLTDLERERHFPLLMRYLQGDFKQGLLERQSDNDRVLTEYLDKQMALIIGKRARQNGLRHYGDQLLDIIKLSALRQRLGLVYGKDVEEVEMSVDLRSGRTMNLFRKILSQAKSRVSAWGGTLYFVYLPAWSRYADVPERGVEQRQRVLVLVKTLGIPTIDIHPAFQAQGDPLSLFPFRKNGHYNEKGHRIVAEEVIKSISVISSARNDSTFN
ncbi:MAG: PAS domain S-box protein [Alphaproteobacteria bacterium]